jgi:hypothetical protein
MQTNSNSFVSAKLHSSVVTGLSSPPSSITAPELDTTATRVRIAPKVSPHDVHVRVESVRSTLQVVLVEMTGTAVAPASLETLIAELLCAGISSREITFLINEALATFPLTP